MQALRKLHGKIKVGSCPSSNYTSWNTMAWRMEPSPKCANLTTTTPCARMHTREGKHLMSMKNIIKIIIYIIAILVMLFHGNRNPDWSKGLVSLNLGIWIAYYVFCSVILPGLACIFWSFLLISVKHILGHAVSLAYTGDAVLHILCACIDSHV